MQRYALQKKLNTAARMRKERKEGVRQGQRAGVQEQGQMRENPLQRDISSALFSFCKRSYKTCGLEKGKTPHLGRAA